MAKVDCPNFACQNGKVIESDWSFDPPLTRVKNCPTCQGEGKIEDGTD